MDDDDLLEKVAVAQEMTPEEMEKHEASRRKGRRRQYVGEEAERVEWEDQVHDSRSNEVSWKVVVSIVMSAMVLLALGIFYYQRSASNSTLGSNEPAIDREKLDALLDQIEEAERNTKKNEEGDAAVKIVDDYKKFDSDKLEEAIKRFVSAESPEELKQYVREPERVGPLLDRYYEKVEYEALGFESVNKLQVSYLGELITTVVTTADFLSSPIAVERIVDGEDEIYKVDWESWIGYCDYTPEEMREKRPSKPFEIRVVVEPASYYNYVFVDDQKWRSLGLEIKGSVYSFLGYVERDSEQDKSLRVLMKNARGVPCLLKVAYPPGSRAKDQVEILEVVTEGWVINFEKEEEDE
ncbi:hypothetical protein N9195_01350 [bacterium]|nr:hypothetical protein [bacterium]